MLSLSDLQSSTVTTSGWFGARRIEQDLPPNMREMGDSTELAFSCPCGHQQRQAQFNEIGAPCSLALSSQSGSRLIESLLRVPLPSELIQVCACQLKIVA